MHIVKKLAVSAIAIAAVASGVFGMSANAYSPTITKTFTVGNGTVTATQYSDTSHSTGTIALNDGGNHSAVSIKMTYSGITNTVTGTTYARVYMDGKGTTSSATGIYSATADTSSGYTSGSIEIVS